MAVLMFIVCVIVVAIIHGIMKSQTDSENKNAVLSAAKTIPNFSAKYSVTNGARGISVDGSQKKVAFLVRLNQGGVKHQVYPFSDVLACELIENGLTVVKTDRLSQIGGALVGGALLGGVGALSGALTGKKQQNQKVQSIVLTVTLNSLENPRYEMSMLNLKDGVEKTSITYTNARKIAEEWQNRMDVIIHQGSK